MARPYSMDLRERVILAIRSGMSCHQAAVQFRVAVSTAVRWARQFRSTGSAAPGRMGGHRPKGIRGEHRDWLIERCHSNDFTLRGLIVELAERGLTVGYRSVWTFVHAEGLSYKKSLIASEQDRPDIARRRAQWWHYQGLIDPSRLVFLDETWVKTNMAPLRGWGTRGARVPIKVPYGHWNTMTFIAALRHDRIDAPWLLDAPMNGALFRTYVEKVLAPTLRPNDIVIADNLSSHTGSAIRRAIRAVG